MNAKYVKEQIVGWLSDYVKKSGTKGFVLGISGGVDSAVVSSLCAETELPTLCVQMPIHQAKNQVSRATKHIERLKAKYANVRDIETDLTPVFDQFVRQIPAREGNELHLANTRARLRMTTLYYYAGLEGKIVAGTGNKIEDFGVGFFTKYGDGGVDISPIGDLLKTEVYELAKELDVIEEIREAKPTDGLFGDDRSDEDQLGATYPELEWAMAQKETGRVAEDFEGRERKVFEIYDRLNRINQHKMKAIPVCVVDRG